MNMQSSLIQKLVLYKFKLGYDICCMRGEGAVGRSTVTRWLKKFHLDCKNLGDQAKSVDTKTHILQTLEANLVNSTYRV